MNGIVLICASRILKIQESCCIIFYCFVHHALLFYDRNIFAYKRHIIENMLYNHKIHIILMTQEGCCDVVLKERKNV